MVRFVPFVFQEYRDRSHFLKTKQCRGKGKVVPVLLLTEHHAIKAYWGSGVVAPLILDLDTRWK